MIDAVKTNLDANAQHVLADAGYRCEAVFEKLRKHPSTVVVELGRESTQQLEVDADKYPRTVEMAAKMRTDEGQPACWRRKWIAELPNGEIKNVLGFRQFSLRGLHRVCAEFKIVCMALNLRRMCALQAA